MKRTHSKLGTRIVSIVAAALLVATLSPAFAFGTPAANADADPAGALSQTPDEADPVSSLVLNASAGATPPDGDARAVSKIVDPDTSATWTELFDLQPDETSGLSYSTENAGRIWVDKSVYASAADAEAAGIPNASLSDPDLDFLVGLSAISAASTIRTEQTAPHDVVFLVSLNSTMASLTYDGTPYAAYLADALNIAIGRLMAENTDDEGPIEPTRVAVVGYSIDVSVLMPLDTYAPDENGDYVVFSPSLPEGAGLIATAVPDTPGTSTASGAFRGSSYLQRGIAVAGGILAAAGADATAERPRVPELVVMGTEVAPAANTNVADPPAYAGQAHGEDGFIGSLPAGRESGFGTDTALATLLTLQYEAERIEAAYAGANAPLGIYTVGLSTQDLGAYVLQTARGQATADIAGSGAAAGTNLRSNIEAARADYARAAADQAGEVSLRLYSSSRGGNLVESAVSFAHPIDGLLSAENGYAFRGATSYLPATDANALPDSFSAAVDFMLDIEYVSPVNAVPTDARSSTDRLRMEDDLGSFMQVKRISGIEFDNDLLDGSMAAAAVAASFADPWNIEASHETHYLASALAARYGLDWNTAFSLLYEAYADGQISYRGEADYSNYAAWYVDDAHEPVASGGLAYTFAHRNEIDAIKSGSWRDDADAGVRETIAAAQALGATAACQTYFYIGNLKNQYTGADVPLYDFVVMVETSLDDGSQRVLFSAPADSLPARKAYVTKRTDGSTVMTLDEDALSTYPMRLVYEVGPRDDIAAIATRMIAGENVSDEELSAALGKANSQAAGSFALYTNAFEAADGAAEGGTIDPRAAMTAVVAASDSYYTFTKDTPLFSLAAGQTAPVGERPTAEELEPLKSAPVAGQTYYYETSFYRASGLGAKASSNAIEERVFEPYTIPADIEIASSFGPDESGCYCALARTPKYEVSAMLDDYAKNPNATATAPFVKRLSVNSYESTGRAFLAARLGNNGLLRLAPEQETGSLTVSKRLESNDASAGGITAADRATSFSFVVTMRDGRGAPLAGTIETVGTGGAPSGMASLDDDGRILVSLTDGQTTTFPSVPAETNVTVEEVGSSAPEGAGHDTASSAFAPSWCLFVDGERVGSGGGGFADAIVVKEGTRVEAAFTNAKTAGSLTIEKTVSGNGADPSLSFPFEVSFAGADGSPLVGAFPYTIVANSDTGVCASGTATTDDQGRMLLENGKQIALSDGQSITVAGLPVGTSYAIAETTANLDGYRTSAVRSVGGKAAEAFTGKGSIDEANQADTVSFENAKWAFGELVVEKRAIGFDGQNERFPFTVALADGAGKPLAGSIDYEIETADGSVARAQATLDDGRFSFELADGETFTASLLQGTRYTVEETAPLDDSVVVKRENNEGIIGEKPTYALFTNVKQAGSLGIAKVVGGNAGDRERPYAFTVTIEGLFEGRPVQTTELSLPATRYSPGGNTASEPVAFERDPNGAGDGTATVALHHNEGLLIGGLASGASFRIVENDAAGLSAEGYDIYGGTDDDFAARPDGVYAGSVSANEAAGVYFVNAKNDYGDLIVSKEVSGNAAEADANAGRTFAFSLFAREQDGTPIVGAYRARLSASGETSSQTVTFDNGAASFALPAGAELLIEGLPAGAAYDVAEQSLKLEGYETTSTNASGTIVAHQTSEARFTNEKSYAPVSVSLAGSEVLRGRDEAAGEFAFQLYSEDGSPVIGENGKPVVAVNRASRAGVPTDFSLPAFSISEPGAHTYAIREHVPEGAQPAVGVVYDERSYEATIVVAADATGALSVVSVSYRVDNEETPGVLFVNEYRTSASAFSLGAHKELDGKAPAESSFAFSAQEIDPATEAPIGAPIFARNGADGSVSFGTFSIEAPMGGSAARSFIVSEAAPPEATAENSHTVDGVRYDTTRFRIDVTAASGATDDEAPSINIDVRVSDLAGNGSYGPWIAASANDTNVAGQPLFRNATETGGGTVDPGDPDDPNPDDPDDPDEPADPEEPDVPGSETDPSNPGEGGTGNGAAEGSGDQGAGSAALAGTGDAAPAALATLGIVAAIALGIVVIALSRSRRSRHSKSRR